MFASLAGERVLVVAAHPDDEILGCGATIHRLTQAEGVACALLLAQGVTARGDGEAEIARLRQQALAAADRVGYQSVRFHDGPDNRLDRLALLDLVQWVEAEVARVRPTVILTHHVGDLNIDHQLTHRAVVTATRPMATEGVRTILAFETLSATEWNPDGPAFRPTVYLPIGLEDLIAKTAALEAYAGELRAFPHPRSREGLRIQAQRRGVESGHELAEAFLLVRTR